MDSELIKCYRCKRLCALTEYRMYADGKRGTYCQVCRAKKRDYATGIRVRQVASKPVVGRFTAKWNKAKVDMSILGK